MIMLPGQMGSHLYVMWTGSALWRTLTSTMTIVPRSWETWFSENLHLHYTFPGLYLFSWMTHQSSLQHSERCEWAAIAWTYPAPLILVWASDQGCYIFPYRTCLPVEYVQEHHPPVHVCIKWFCMVLNMQ